MQAEPCALGACVRANFRWAECLPIHKWSAWIGILLRVDLETHPVTQRLRPGRRLFGGRTSRGDRCDGQGKGAPTDLVPVTCRGGPVSILRVGARPLAVASSNIAAVCVFICHLGRRSRWQPGGATHDGWEFGLSARTLVGIAWPE